MITLTTQVERHALMQKELDKAGVEVRMFLSEPVGQLERNAAAALEQFGRWGITRIQHRAATESHYRAMERFLESDADLGVFLEDDIFISPELSSWLHDLNWWPTDADIVKLERWNDKRLKLVLGAQPILHLERKIAKLLSRHTGSAGYILNRAAASKIVERWELDMPIDHILFNKAASAISKELRIYQVSPALVCQGNEPEYKVKQARDVFPVRGWTKVRQELLRAWHEIRILPLFLFAIATGQAKIESVEWRRTMEMGKE